MEKTSLDKKSQITQAKKAESPLQAKMDGKQPPQFKLDASQNSGGGLSPELNTQMSSAMGTDFSDVKVHTDSAKATSAGALAYAQGNDVHFAPGQFNPGTSSGQELIGHELAHVKQQREGRVKATSEAGGMPVNDDKGLESEADSMGRKAAQMKVDSNASAPSGGAKSAGGGAAQMKEDPLKVKQGQVTFDAEGQDSGKYFSRVCHWPGGNSGVTIGRGYDLGSRTKEGVLAHLKASGITGNQASLLSQGAGLKGKAAGDWVAANKSKVGEINHDQQKLLFEIVYAEHKQDVVRLSDKKDVKEKYGAVNFENLHPAIMEILVDLRYRGDYHSRSRAWIQPIVVKNDLKAFASAMADSKWMSDYGVPKARFESRKNFMAAALAGKTPTNGPSKDAPEKGETTSKGSSESQSTTVIDSGSVTASSLNVRSGAGPSFGKVGSPLTSGTAVKVYEKKNGWLRIGNGQWVSGEYVKLTGKKEEAASTTAPSTKDTSGKAIASGTVTASQLNVRSTSNTSGKVVGSLKSGDKVQIFEEKDGWFRIAEGQWISGKYVKKAEGTKPAEPEVKKETGVVTASQLNIRAGASTDAQVVGTLTNGAKVEILEERSGWFRIGTDKWVSAKFISKGGASAGGQTSTGGGNGAAPNWLGIAQAEVGVTEIVGAKHNPRVIEYHSTTGKFKDDETPWCSSFANWVMNKAGKGGTNNAMAMSWTKYGKKLTKPAYGSIVVFSYGGGKGHVGFVVGKQGSKLQVLGGNQSNQVKISSFSTSQVAAYVVPSDYEVPAAAYNLGEGAKVEDSGGVAGTR